MKPSTRRLFGRITVLVVLAAGAGAYATWTRPWDPKPVPVRVEKIAERTLHDVLAVNGQIVPSKQVDIAAPVAGQIEAVMVEEGQSVSKGDRLAQIDDSIAAAAAKQASASLQSARIALEEAETSLGRAEALGTALSAKSLDSARFAFETAKANVEQLAAAEAQALEQLTRYTITTPMSGTLLTVMADPGQVVSTGSMLFTAGDLASPRVEASVDEAYGGKMEMGLTARVAPIGAEEPMAAEVSFVAPTVDPDTGSRTVRLAFDQPPEDQFPSGLTVSVNIIVATHDSAIGVPRAAIIDLDSAPHVLVVDDGVAVARTISVADWPSDILRVTDGLAAGDQLILDPETVKSGSLVAVQPAM